MLWSPRETGLPAACPPMLDIHPPTQEVCSLWTVGTMPYVCLENENTGSLPGCLHQLIPRLFLKT